MGRLVNGVWSTEWYDTASTGGRFVRQDASFRNWITADGAPGPSGTGGFRAEPGRYHLIVAMACPWAHRTLIVRALKGLQDIVTVSRVEPLMLDDGWTFADPEPETGALTAWQVYVKADPQFTGRATVPILWDRKQRTIVSNESAEIIRMFNSAFDDITGNHEDFRPEDLHDEIDAINERVYHEVNNGVYKAGFATSQDAYDSAVTTLFAAMDWLEELLSRRRYLAGDRITEADWRLFTTLLRFDRVYHGHFKCNRNKLTEFPNLWAYARELYQYPGVAETDHPDHYERHYHYSHDMVNPHRIIPIGPDENWDEPHGRGD